MADEAPTPELLDALERDYPRTLTPLERGLIASLRAAWLELDECRSDVCELAIQRNGEVTARRDAVVERDKAEARLHELAHELVDCQAQRAKANKMLGEARLALDMLAKQELDT